MSADFPTLLTKLQTAIIDNKPDEAIEFLGRKTPSLPSRLNAYIQGYRIRLMKTVENDYPALKHYLGDQKFHHYVANYVEQTPSQSYTIDQYPIGFAEYIKDHTDDSGAISLAILESAIARVFWLPDSEPFVPEANFSMEQLFTLKLEHRTASMLLKLPADAESYLSLFRDGSTPDTIAKPCHLMIVRHENEVRRHRLNEVEFILLDAIHRHPFAEALEKITHHESESEIGTNLSEWLIKWITLGFFKQPST